MVSYNWKYLLKFSKFNPVIIIHIDIFTKFVMRFPQLVMRFITYQKCLPKFSIIDFNISEVHFPQCFQNKQPKHMCDFNQTFKIFWFATHFKPFFRVWMSVCSGTLSDKEPVPFFVVTGKLSHSWSSSRVLCFQDKAFELCDISKTICTFLRDFMIG